MPSSQLPLLCRYLWAQSPVSSPLPKGTLLAGRYEVVQYPLLRDTQPETPAPPLTEVPPLAVPYLALSAFSIAIPRPFTQVPHPDGKTSLLLLEEVPLQGSGDRPAVPTLLPTLVSRWPQSSALHQLTWLWRLAKLWPACQEHQVAHDLLDEQNLRVDGEDLRLIKLEQTSQAAPTLADLGQYWQTLVPTAAPSIRDYLGRLTQALTAHRGQPRGLIQSLVQALEQHTTQFSMRVQLATYSDQGPTRDRNEDACYPASGSVQTATLDPQTKPGVPPLVVVCDGVGGHEGGDVASQSAIAEVTQQLQQLAQIPHCAHSDIVMALKQAIIAANQRISNRNDADQRRDRGRMGTTIVMALVVGGRLYVAHLGDSRAYRVRSHNCRQLTLDDDVAAREMRLGLELYQDALQNPGAGALVQALGMASADHLHPTVKLYPIAADSLVLLCSDGLSDHELVDRLWPAELLPVLRGDRDIDAAAQRLITLANTHNGHDNVTVGLLRLQPQPSPELSPVPVELADLLSATPAAASDTTRLSTSTPALASQSVSPTPSRQRVRVLPLLLSSILIATIAGIGGALGWQWLSRRQTVGVPEAPSTSTGEALSPSASPPSDASANNAADFSVGDYLQIQQITEPSSAATIWTTQTPPVPPPSTAIDLPKRVLTVGSIVKVVSRRQTSDGQIWVRLEVCSATAATATEGLAEVENNEVGGGDRVLPLALPGDQGWLGQADLPIFAQRLLDISNIQQGMCMD